MQEKQKPQVRYFADLPYPPVQSSTNNPRYGLVMLDNMGGQNSEMSAVSLYFYNHLITDSQKELSDAFHHISIVEMHHLEIFGQLALQCKENPRLWSRNRNRYQYWSPGYNQYPTGLDALLLHSIREEAAARDKYLRQAGWIEDANIKENLERIAQDEQLHIELLTALHQKFCCG